MTTAAQTDQRQVTGQQWRWSVLAGMASFLDAGSIVALGASLEFWKQYLGLSNNLVGLLTAIGPNAIGCAIGAVIGGRLGDLLGRKRIYQWDLIVYAVGVLLIAVSVNTPMLLIGTVIVGIAVGADVPTSLALVGEFAPDGARGKLLGFSQIAWNAGPVIVLLAALAMSNLGLLGGRILFVILLVVALVTYLLRRGMVESQRWTAASGAARQAGVEPGQALENAPIPKVTISNLRGLLSGPMIKALLWTLVIYLFWNLAAGTNGIFTPYIITSLKAGSQAASVGLSCAGFVIGILAGLFIFMPLADRGYVTRRTMWGIGALMQIAAFMAYLIFPFAIPVIIANIVLFGVGGALAGEAVYKTFSQELFPTMLRGTAQGLTFGVSRLCLGIWSFFVPTLAESGIKPVAALLAIFLAISGVVGFFGMPDTVGKSLEQIERERGTAKV
ncbi:inositol transporter-like SP family MFS transporter [Friedmanniella endophytica]|uniref:Inositol transporter-like SP family MFS transporter n=1 Tax=Microlunatus kandeliicorticis TaxID=1759536 RepID=A0A7W3IUD2_9ACTN|nr:MFS transporter [Microlunatus kandeliicorticis]MBA8795428.1 inositol transporter-like SP family MFS transporter [Microlunatus kandeliicorticis]